MTFRMTGSCGASSQGTDTQRPALPTRRSPRSTCNRGTSSVPLRFSTLNRGPGASDDSETASPIRSSGARTEEKDERVALGRLGGDDGREGGVLFPRDFDLAHGF